jgi:hypothetical protein
MRSIVVRFEFPDDELVGYEDCIDELIIEDLLTNSDFHNVGIEILEWANLE